MAPAAAQIPPDNQLSRNNPDIVVTLGKYSPTRPVVNVQIYAVINAGQAFPPFSEELLEIGAANTPASLIDVAQYCNRTSAMNRVLECQIPFELSAIDASNPTTMVRARLLVRKSNPVWQGYIVGGALTSLQSGQGGMPGSGANTTADANAGGNPVQCPTENAPMMPTSTANGAFQFSIAQQDLCDGEFWIDPPIAIGYRYTVTGATFSKVTMPSAQTVADTDGYVFRMPATTTVPVRAMASQSIDFPSGITEFVVSNIDASLQLDPTDPLAFAIGLDLSAPTGDVTIIQTPLTAPAPAPTVPIANAGQDTSVPSGSGYTLDGSASSDPEGDALTYSWTQVSGPQVALTGANTSTPSFAFPNTAGSLHFKLTVTDPAGNQAQPDYVVVNFQNVVASNSGPSGLLGDAVTVLVMSNTNYPATHVVGPGSELVDYGTAPFSPNASPRRWNIDLSASKFRIAFLHPGGDAGSGGAADYGNGFVFNFTDLNPSVPGCLGTPIVTDAVTSTSNSAAPLVVSGTQFSDHSVTVPLAPPSGVYNWTPSDWIEVDLTFGCRINGQVQLINNPNSPNNKFEKIRDRSRAGRRAVGRENSRKN